MSRGALTGSSAGVGVASILVVHDRVDRLAVERVRRPHPLGVVELRRICVVVGRHLNGAAVGPDVVECRTDHAVGVPVPDRELHLTVGVPERPRSDVGDVRRFTLVGGPVEHHLLRPVDDDPLLDDRARVSMAQPCSSALVASYWSTRVVGTARWIGRHGGRRSVGTVVGTSVVCVMPPSGVVVGCEAASAPPVHAATANAPTTNTWPPLTSSISLPCRLPLPPTILRRRRHRCPGHPVPEPATALCEDVVA